MTEHVEMPPATPEVARMVCTALDALVRYADNTHEKRVCDAYARSVEAQIKAARTADAEAARNPAGAVQTGSGF